MTSYAVVLPVDENQMSADTLQVNNSVVVKTATAHAKEKDLISRTKEKDFFHCRQILRLLQFSELQHRRTVRSGIGRVKRNRVSK